MATRTGVLSTGGNFVNWRGIDIILSATEVPITIKFGSPGMVLVNGNNEQVTFRLYLVVDNSWTNYSTLGDITIAALTSSTVNTTYTITAGDRSKFKGKELYLRGWVTTDGNSTTRTAKITLSSNTGITVTTRTGVIAGNQIYKTDLTDNGITPDDASLIKYRAKFSSGTTASASTFNSQVLGI